MVLWWKNGKDQHQGVADRCFNTQRKHCIAQAYQDLEEAERALASAANGETRSTKAGAGRQTESRVEKRSPGESRWAAFSGCWSQIRGSSSDLSSEICVAPQVSRSRQPRYLDPLTDRGVFMIGAACELISFVVQPGPADTLETQGPIDVEEVESVQSDSAGFSVRWHTC